MLWPPATRLHARAAWTVSPARRPICLSSCVSCPHGALVPSQAGVAACLELSSRQHAFLAGQPLAASRSFSFVSLPPRWSSRKPLGALKARLNAGSHAPSRSFLTPGSVPPFLCLQVLASASPGAPLTLWVKRTDVVGARYDIVKNVDAEQLVAEFIARWVAQAKLDVDPGLVSLRLVKCGARKPSSEEEKQAVELDDPRLSLAHAAVSDGCSLLIQLGADVQARGDVVWVRRARHCEG
jgi:hypothetical protein